MFHPVITSRIGQVTFAVWWIAVSAIHFAVFSFFYSIPYPIAAADSLISNIFYALLSLGLWYWVRISDIETSKPFSIVINHLGAAALSITLIVFLQQYILSSLFSDNQDYVNSLNGLILGRAITGTLMYALVVLIYYLIIYIQSFREKLSREGELKALVKDAELNWLKLQINPHFLFNSLNSVSSLTMTSPERAQEMIIRLSELLRYSLRQSPDSMVKLENELDNCIKYLEIEKVRFGSRLKYTINATQQCLSAMVPGMIIQPLFENAIKHSVAQTTEESLVEANIGLIDRGVEIKVTNTLPAESTPTNSTGVGLENIRRRLQIIYGSSTYLKTQKTETTFTASLIIPFDNSNE